MSQDEEHLRLLSIFHYAVGGLAALFGCFPIIHLGLGIALVFDPQVFGPAKKPPPAFIGWLFIVVAGTLMLAGWTLAVLIAWAGRCLQRRRHYQFCFVMACVACLFMPFGTVLGVFTILVLSRPAVKKLFGQPVVAG